jgi:uroporphyrinogen-III synthase
MRVLVTRPEPDAERTASRLRAMGHEAVRLPLFELKVTADPEQLPPSAAIIGIVATSARAFALFGGRALPPGYAQVPVHAVGPVTARAARRAGFQAIHAGVGGARDLIGSLAEPTDDSPAPCYGGVTHWLYLAGRPRKPLIEEAFAAAGKPLLVTECYQMMEISYSTDYEFLRLLSPLPDVILLYSANAAARLIELITAKNLGNSLDSVRLACLSPEILAELPIALRSRAVAAERPDEDSLLASLAGLG